MSEHRWSGWPGAFCLKCGRSDPEEQALADNEIDVVFDEHNKPVGIEYVSEQVRERVARLNVCPVPDTAPPEEE